MEKVIAIIPAAGSGKRMQQGKNKQFLNIGGMTIIERTLRAFENASLIDEIIIVSKLDEINMIDNLVQEKNITKVRVIVEGGKERQDSIYEGLKQTRSQDQWILVHDGARPFVTSHEIDGFVQELKSSEALIMAVPSKDTIKRVQGDQVLETLDRTELWNVQTPQGFSRNLIVCAYEEAHNAGYYGTDDASLVEWNGDVVKVYKGTYENIKVTTPDDLYIGEAILKMKGEL